MAQAWYYMSAYALAVKHGYTGTEEEWLADLKGEQGVQGIQGPRGYSNYEIAVANGYEGTEAEWLASVDAARIAAATSATQAAANKAAAQAAATEAAGSADAAAASATAAQVMAATPKVVTSTSAMTDETRIYVLVDNTSDYDGYWYYHDGSAWTPGGLYNAEAINTDTALTTSGAAADAKKVGDRLKKTWSLDAGSSTPVTAITENADLNTYTTPGNFKATSNTIAGSLSNSPTTVSFRMIVTAIHSDSYIFQFVYNNYGEVYMRSKSNTDAWRSWYRLLTTKDQGALKGVVEDYSLYRQADVTQGATWVSGTINSSTGANSSNSKYIRTNTYIPVIPGTKLVFKGIKEYISSGNSIGMASFAYLYTEASPSSYLKRVNLTSPMRPATVPPQAKFMRITYGMGSGSETITGAGVATFAAMCRVDAVSGDILKQGRYEIKSVGGLTPYGADYIHQAFPFMVRWGDGVAISHRVAKAHYTPFDNSDWGGVAIYQANSRGELDYGLYPKRFKAADFSGLLGEIRAIGVIPTPDGQHLLAAGVTTYYDDNQDTTGNPASATGRHHNVLAIMDKPSNGYGIRVASASEAGGGGPNYVINPGFSTSECVVDEETAFYVTRHFFGNPILTPTGHPVVAGYATGAVALIRGSEAIAEGTESLAAATYAVVPVYTAPNAQQITFNQGTDYLALSEPSIGYATYNGKTMLYVLCRDTGVTVDGNTYDNTVLFWTDDLELTGAAGSEIHLPQDRSGVQTNAAAADRNTAVFTDLLVHAPRLLPKWEGRYLPFCGAMYTRGVTRRVPIIGYVDLKTYKIAGYAVIDDTLSNHGAYCSFVHVNDQIFDVCYYEEGLDISKGVSDSAEYRDTQLLYRRVNMRELIPGMDSWEQ